MGQFSMQEMVVFGSHFGVNQHQGPPAAKIQGIMRCTVPKRFSLQWWSWLASGALVFSVCSGLFLYQQGSITGINFILLVVAVSFVGDLALALSFEAMAPTRVIIGPGDRVKRGSAVKETASIISGFENGAVGKVIVRGEIWTARCVSEDSCSLAVGENVRVLGREGLTLLISGRAADA